MWSYLGQNFLIDSKIKSFLTESIRKTYEELWCDTIIEIWPGKWALTRRIFDIPKNFFAIEKDQKMLDTLKKINRNNLKKWSHSEWNEESQRWFDISIWPNIIHQDILEFDISTFISDHKLDPKKILIVGNLPYYITSPIIRKFFGYGQQDFAAGIFLVQKEPAEKFTTQAIKKSYLRWLLNYAYQVKKIKSVPPKAFKPAPKVHSAIIKIHPCTSEQTNWSKQNIDFTKLQNFLDLYNPFSRKTLQAIETHLRKKWETTFTIPTELKKKRLGECGREDISLIVG